MRDTRAERTVLRALRVDVHPLVVARCVGETVDADLFDREPCARAERVADGLGQFAGMREHAGRREHEVEGRAHHACWLLTDSTSPVMYDA